MKILTLSQPTVVLPSALVSEGRMAGDQVNSSDLMPMLALNVRARAVLDDNGKPAIEIGFNLVPSAGAFISHGDSGIIRFASLKLSV